MIRIKLTRRAFLERYRDWLLHNVIPGYERLRPGDSESVRRAVQQLNEIEGKLAKIKYPRERKSL